MKTDYKIIFSRRRTLSIIISPDKGIVVRAPSGTSPVTIEKFVREKEKWIIKHTEKYSGITRLKAINYNDCDVILFKGKKYKLRLINSATTFVNLSEELIEVGTDSRDGKVKIILDKWLKMKAEEFITEKLRETLTDLNDATFNPAAFVIKPLKSRWGSCSHRGRITINSELVKLEERFTRYVIIHELCHLRFHNHGTEFYRLLGNLCPDYRSVRKDLRKFITR